MTMAEPFISDGSLVLTVDGVRVAISDPTLFYWAQSGPVCISTTDPNAVSGETLRPGFNPRTMDDSMRMRTQYAREIIAPTRVNKYAPLSVTGPVWLVVSGTDRPFFEGQAPFDKDGATWYVLRVDRTGAIPDYRDTDKSIQREFYRNVVLGAALLVAAPFVAQASVGAPLAETAAVIGPTDFELATAGMGVGITPAPVATVATVAETATAATAVVTATPAPAAWTFAEVTAGAKTAIQTAGAVVSVVKAVETVTGTGVQLSDVAAAARQSAIIASNANKTKTALDSLMADPKTLYYLGAAVIAAVIL